jgi:aminoglycoside 6'-N-acetyltransferase
MHPPLSHLPTIEGPVVTLRPPGAGEIAELASEFASDPETSPWWGDDASTVMEWFDDPDYHVLVIEAEGKASGVIAFEEQLDPGYHAASIDIGLLAGNVGRGVGTSALKALARWLVGERGHHRLTIDPAVANQRAIHVYEKVGFRPIGVARSYELGPDGAWHDNLLMDMLAEELAPE